MKKGLIIFLIIFLFISCVTNKGDINIDNHPEEDLITVYFKNGIVLHQINDHLIDNPISAGLSDYYKIRLPHGLIEFHVSFFATSASSTHTVTFSSERVIKVTGMLEKNNTYLVTNILNNKNRTITYHIYKYNNRKQEEEVTIIQTNPFHTLLNHTKYILTPIENESVKRTVSLENNNFILLLKPDMAYSLTNKDTGTTTEGRYGFRITPQTGIGALYLLETNLSQMSISQFQSNNYIDNAQIVLLVKNCSETSVTYVYERPSSLKEKELTFSISLLTK